MKNDELIGREEVLASFCHVGLGRSRYDRYEDVDWHFIMKDCDCLFAKALQILATGNVRLAVEYPLQWLSCFCDTFTEESFSYDHEGITFSFACKQAIKIIEQVMRNPNADADFRKMVNMELSAIAGNTTIFDDYCFINLKAFIKRMEAMTLSDEEALANIEKLIQKNEFGVDLADLIIQKSTILFSMGKPQEAMCFLENNLREEEVCKYLIELLVKRHEYDHAIDVLEKAIRYGDEFFLIKRLEKEIEIYLLQGKEKEVTEVYRRLFLFSNGSYEIYKILKKRVAPEEWKDFLDELMRETTFSYSSFEINDKAEILKEEYGEEALLDYLCTADNYYKLELYFLYATQLSDKCQATLIPYYMDALREMAASAKKRDHYCSVRFYMNHLLELNKGEDAVKILLAEFRELYYRRSSFMKELNLIDNKISRS